MEYDKHCQLTKLSENSAYRCDGQLNALTKYFVKQCVNSQDPVCGAEKMPNMKCGLCLFLNFVYNSLFYCHSESCLLELYVLAISKVISELLAVPTPVHFLC